MKNILIVVLLVLFTGTIVCVRNGVCGPAKPGDTAAKLATYHIMTGDMVGEGFASDITLELGECFGALQGTQTGVIDLRVFKFPQGKGYRLNYYLADGTSFHVMHFDPRASRVLPVTTFDPGDMWYMGTDMTPSGALVNGIVVITEQR